MRTNHSVDLAVGITLPPTLSNLKVLMPRNTHTHTTLQNMQYKIQTVCIYAQGRHQPHSASLASLHSTPARYKPDNLVWHIQSEKHKIFSSLALTENDHFVVEECGRVKEQGVSLVHAVMRRGNM